MAIVTGTGITYNLAGATGVGKTNREDLTDIITNISPTQTPFISGIGRVDAEAVLHEWNTDSLATHTAANAQIEGDDLTSFTTPTSTTRVTNYTQILRKDIVISGTQDRVRKAGKGTELAYQIAKKTKEMARDLEASATQNTQSVQGNATTARQMNGIAGFITTNETNNSGTATVTQAHINVMLQDIWTAGGDPDCLFVGGANKRIVSGLTTGVTKNLDARDRRLVTAVDVYESDFGVLQVIPDRFQTTDDVYAIEKDLWKLAVLRPLKVEPLAKTGDASKRLLVMEATLECRAENGNGSIINCNIS